jgi:hypothetical protein
VLVLVGDVALAHCVAASSSTVVVGVCRGCGCGWWSTGIVGSVVVVWWWSKALGWGKMGLLEVEEEA